MIYLSQVERKESFQKLGTILQKQDHKKSQNGINKIWSPNFISNQKINIAGIELILDIKIDTENVLC